MHLGTVGAAIGFGCFSNVQLFIDLSAEETVSSGGSKGGGASLTPPGVQILSISCKKFGKIVCWRPPGELAPPPRGNPGSATGKTVITPVSYLIGSVSSIKSKKKIALDNATEFYSTFYL